MKVKIDSNKLLVIENEKIPKTKEYTYNVGGYIFSDFDKGMIILHKKDWKIINLKNLGDGMNVVYYKGITNEKAKLHQAVFEDALRTFKGFDEETGEKYYFIPNLGEKDIQEKNKILKNFSTGEIKKTPRGVMVELQHTKGNMINKAPETEEILSYLFGLVLIYGKFDSKNGELSSIKIQLPLFGQYLAQQEILDQMLKSLQDEGIFLKADKLPNKNGIIYQISSNDYELLEIFANWYEAVEKFTKITKREFTEEMKTKLIQFIQSNPDIPSAGKDEVLKKIKNGTIKLLTKN